ncbi:MAG: AAA family ATPase [Spirochaetia bacterium]|nr:AAA family ATPase [Spirochaetia bacterium]
MSSLGLSDLFEFLRRERFQEDSSSWENFHRSVDDRVENHLCVKDCRVVERSANGLVLACPENTSRFREADMVLLNREGASGRETSEGFEMEWIRFDPRRSEIHLEKSFRTRREQIPFEVGDTLILDDPADQLQASLQGELARIHQDPGQTSFFESFLSGTMPDQKAEVDEASREKVFRLIALTPEQREAFTQAVSHYPVSGVQGPPGTGKTQVLAALTAYYLLRGMEVLVSAVSHFAINNALSRISEMAGSLHAPGQAAHLAVKVSRSKNAGLDPRVLRVSHLRLLGSELARSAHVYGMTPYKFPHEIAPGRFRLLILDEASQASLPFALAAMRYAKKTILIGDHRQMRPIIPYPHHPKKLYRSVFEHFAEEYPDRLATLHETFRMNAPLTGFPSRLFYGSRLKSSPDAAGRLLEVSALKADPILDPEKPSVFVSVPHLYSHKYSSEEASLVLETLERLLGAGVAPRDIAVLVPFRSQQNHIRKHLHLLEAKHGSHLRDLLVDTVERMQGQEREVVIYSLTISDLGRLAMVADYFFDLNRFNVALTRAKTKRIVFGSPNMLLTRPEDPAVLARINVFAEFMNGEGRVVVTPEECALLEKKWGY